MTSDPRGLSPATFDQVLARALELDEQGRERIDFARAREIAGELGVSAEAWEAAVREHRSMTRTQRSVASVAGGHWRSLLALVAGGGVGSAWGAMAAAGVSGDLDPLLAVGVAAASLAYVMHQGGRCSRRQELLELGGWWTGIAGGIMVAFGEVLNDPALFAASAFAACAVSGAFRPRLLRGLGVWVDRYRTLTD